MDPPTMFREPEALAETAATLTLEQQRELVLRLAPRVFAQLSEEEQEKFLGELSENLSLVRATSQAVEGDSNPGAWEMPEGE